LAVVGDDEEHLLPFPDLSDVENVWMIQLAQYLILADEASHISYLALVNSLDGYALLGQSVLGLVHNSKSSLSDFLLEEVLILDVAVACLQKESLLNDHVLVEPFVD